MIKVDELPARLYELNCASAEWYEAGHHLNKELFKAGQERFEKAVQWFHEHDIKLSRSEDPKGRSIYTLKRE